jgi:hypothetical protein
VPENFDPIEWDEKVFPFPPCDEEHDGDEYVTPEGGRFVCRRHPDLGWVWQTAEKRR